LAQRWMCSSGMRTVWPNAVARALR
jgi:hypothetical protein